MSVDLTDPDVTLAYNEIIQNKGKDWLLLTYGQTRDKLTLLSSGLGTSTELCEAVPRTPGDVYFGFCREKDGDNNHFAILAFVPETVSGVKRARALVHSRAVGSLFKAANVSMNVSNLDAENTNRLRERLQLGPSYIPRLASPNNRPVQRSASMPTDARSSSESATDGLKGLPPAPRTRMYASESQGRQSPLSPLHGSHIPRIPSEIDDDDRPPPTPPKDPRQGKSASSFTKSASTGSAFEPTHRYGRSSISEAEGDEVVISPAGSMNGRRSHMGFTPPRVPPRVVSPAEKEKMRLEAQKKREAEELQAQREEAERQTHLKQQKEEALRQAQEEEERRIAKIEAEKRHALAERARREREVKLEEEIKLQELEMRKRQEKERRRLQAQRLEEERQESERRTAEAAKKQDETRRAAEVMRKERMKEIQEKFAQADRLGAASVLFTGYVTVQTNVSNSWKRRFFELKSDVLALYRDSQDLTTPFDLLRLGKGRIGAIKEPHEGYDELEAIPHAFAVEFTDGEGPWSMFCDSAEDKDILMSLLSQIAGV